MKKLTYILLTAFLLLTAFEAEAKKQSYHLDELAEYNLTIQPKDRYTNIYSGNYEGLSLSFLGTEKEVTFVTFMFKTGDNTAYTNQIMDVLKALMPDDFTPSYSFSSKFINKLNKLKKDRDDEILSAEGIRFDMSLNNGMIHIEAIPKKFYNLIQK